VHDLIQDGSMAAISMEYVDGESWRSASRRSMAATVEEPEIIIAGAAFSGKIRIPQSSLVLILHMTYWPHCRLVVTFAFFLNSACGLWSEPIYQITVKHTEPSPAPLWIAAETGQVNTVRTLLENGVDVDAKNAKGATALWLAASNGHLEVVRLLLEKGAAVDAKNDNGVTPLWTAAANGHLEVVRLLLRARSRDETGAGIPHSGINRTTGGLAFMAFNIGNRS